MTIQEYIDSLNKKFKSGFSREHAYRTELEQLIRHIVKSVDITNEPANVTDCGNPDYVITKGKIPVGYIEAKDIGKDLNSKNYNEQFTRYKKALDNLIITDYTWFQFFQNGELVHEIKIAEIEDNSIKPISDNFEAFENLIKNFCTFVGQTIKSSKKLAEMMAAKARLLENTIERALTSDEETKENTSLRGQYESFKHILIHDLSPKGFADIYAQTLAYGMFAARLHDPTLEDFSRQEAAELIPKTNPFLRKLFGYIAGPDIDDRIKRTVDNLADVFRATNVDALLHNFGKSTQMHDPIIHFYETFLAEYNPKLRKSRGVWYTPEPVVNFIVRAVDDILKSEFGLSQGLADTTKTTIEIDTQTKDKRSQSGYKKDRVEVHKVQILDPAAGTGTFLAEVVKQIYKNFEGQEGIWNTYVDKHLLPRLNGFEILMASYAMAHLKLDLLLTETGYKPTKDQRFRVYLTNSLEESHPDTGTLFANWLSTEANEANHIKRDTPVMCIIGNPPYAVSSTNKSEWIQNLLKDYKKEPGGKEKLKERNPKMINDDYVKFIRYGQYLIEKNGEGVLAFINPHGFLDNLTFRGMRWNLLKTFDKVYTIDLHGNSRKNEVSPDGTYDQNVFDIMQGVSINFFIKTGNKKVNELGKVFHYDLFGIRDFKYDFLSNNSLNKIPFIELQIVSPDYFFINKDYNVKKKYNIGFQVNEIFKINSVGITTSNDAVLINHDIHHLEKNVSEFYNIEIDKKLIYQFSYRPFDFHNIYYDTNKIGRARQKVMKHFIDNVNIGLSFEKIVSLSKPSYSDIFVVDSMIDKHTLGGASYLAPLYLYHYNNEQQSNGLSTERTPNLNEEIVKQIVEKLGLTFTNEKETAESTFAPIDILDYIYAVLHSPTYREKYKEFLKIDFPRVPYPKDQGAFWEFVKLGGELRQIHLLESPIVDKYITTYPQDGNNAITRRIRQKDFEITDDKKGLGRAWINDEQYFDKVPVIAWEFYIGGYQPAQKWLKDRHGRTLSYEDIMHYQKIIVALTETNRLMKEIDKMEF